MVEAERRDLGASRRVIAPLRRNWHTLVVSITTLGVIGPAVTKVILQTAWPVGGDLALHLVAIAWLREYGLHSWTFGWFGGMPLFYFYFPLPAAIGIVIAELFGLGLAMRLLVAIGPLTLPFAVMFLARAGGATRPEAAAAGIGGAVFLHLRSMAMLGGTLEASAIGEYSYSIALTLGLVYVGVIWSGRAMLNRILVASLLMASVALSHLIVTLLVVAVSLAPFLRGRKTAAVVIATWGVGFLLSAFWTVPFLVRMPEMAEVWWRSRATGISLLLIVEFVLLAILVFLGFALDRSRLARVIPFVALGAAGLLPLAIPVPFLAARGLPFLMLALCVLASVSLLNVARAARAAKAPVRVATALCTAVGLAAIIFLFPVTRSPMYLVLVGSEAAVDRAEWEEMRRVLNQAPPGAFVWARNPPPIPNAGFSLFRYTMDQLPLRDKVRTLGGLLQESAPTSQYVREAQRNLSGFSLPKLEPFTNAPPDFNLGVAQAAMLGARYLVLSGDRVLEAARKHGGLNLRVDSGSWAIAELPEANVALAFSDRPPDPCTSEVRCRDWFATAPGVNGTPIGRWGEGDIVLENGTIRFRTSYPGQPHLLRLSYFPTWRLKSAGEGPHRFGPNHMLITPRTREVVLKFSPGTPVRAGRVLTLVGLGLLLMLMLKAPQLREFGS